MNIRPNADRLKSAPAQSRITLASLARDHLEKCDNDIALARESLIKQLSNDVVTLRIIVDDVLSEAAHSRLRASILAQRANVIRMVPDGRAAVRAAAYSEIQSLLDFPLANGMRLRDAMRDDCLVQAAVYTKRAATEQHRARWLTLVAKATPANKTVGESLGVEKINAFWEKAHAK